MRTTSLLATTLLIFTAFAGCLHDNSVDDMDPNTGCLVLLQTVTDSSNNLGFSQSTNYTYDSGCRVTATESNGMTYQNTTYDSDGNIATIETAVTVDQGASWYYTTTTHLWGEP